MRQLNVTVKDKNTIILAEDGKAGDYINLAELTNVDFSQIEDLIEKGQDKVYEKKLNEFKQLLLTQKEAALNQQKDEHHLAMLKKDKELEALKFELNQKHQSEVAKLNEKISNYDSNKKLEEQKLVSKYELELKELKSKYEALQNTLSKEVENSKLKIEQQYQSEIQELRNKLNLVEANFVLKVTQKEAEMNEKLNKVELECATKLNEKEQIINQLQNQKSALNVKMIGENLEATCNDEMESYMQNGFLNCTWKKDNTVIKDEGESKGSKADYIFKVYATEDHNENELLTSVCLDMKDENPDSKNKLKNSDHYAALDKNRNKKGCKYAVLVSTLEMKTNNDLPIRKVNEYPDMYVVRPAYMVSFLSMITSLSMKFKSLLLQDVKEKLEVKSKQELLDKFEEIKNSYLDKQLQFLEKEVNAIRSKGEVITKAASDIDELCNKITNNYINIIQQKLDVFDAKVSKAYRAYEKSF